MFNYSSDYKNEKISDCFNFTNFSNTFQDVFPKGLIEIKMRNYLR